MKIACISDIHGRHDRIKLPPADILVVAGDLTNLGRESELEDVGRWLRETPYKYKIVVAGNHDWGFQRFPAKARQLIGDGKNGVVYLQDSGVTVEGISFWGSPWQPEFHNWAFNVFFDTNKTRPKNKSSVLSLEDFFAMIPKDVDVLVTHGPPYRMLDQCPDGRRVGSHALWEHVLRVKPKLHVFGHIHHSYGSAYFEGTTFLNAAACDETYLPFNPVQVIEL